MTEGYQRKGARMTPEIAKQIVRAYIWQGKGSRDEATDAFDVLSDLLGAYQVLEDKPEIAQGDIGPVNKRRTP